MRRMCGFIIFWIAFGIAIGLYIGVCFWSVFLVFILFILGYNLFCN